MRPPKVLQNRQAVQADPILLLGSLRPACLHGWVVWVCRARKFRAFALDPGFRAFAQKISRVFSRSYNIAPRVTDRSRTIKINPSRRLRSRLALTRATAHAPHPRMRPTGPNRTRNPPNTASRTACRHRSATAPHTRACSCASRCQAVTGQTWAAGWVCLEVSCISRIWHRSNISR